MMKHEKLTQQGPHGVHDDLAGLSRRPSYTPEPFYTLRSNRRTPALCDLCDTIPHRPSCHLYPYINNPYFSITPIMIYYQIHHHTTFTIILLVIKEPSSPG